MKSNRKKYKIVVLSDLNGSSSTILKSTVGLAKMIDGAIEVFHVRKPTEVVASENQLSAMRAINQEHVAIKREMQSLIRPISENYKINIRHSFAFGNVKDEIAGYIKENRPDVIVLGKRKAKPLGFGDRISKFVLNIYDGMVMIAKEDNAFVPDNGISLGMLNSSTFFSNLEFAEALMKHTQKPLKSFKIIKNSSKAKELSQTVDKTTIEYVFEHNDDAINTLSNYLSKNNIDLLSIDRAWKESEKQGLMMPDINSLINQINTTLLVSGR